MKLKPVLSCLAVVILSASSAFAQTTLAKWTFETSTPTTAGPFSPEAGTETGTAMASGFHSSGAAVYSSPAGNGSSHSFSANTWTVGDYYQFTVSTVGAHNVVVSFDQTSSNTGPGGYQLQYSTDGVHFFNFGSAYTVLANNTPNTPWTASAYNPAYSFTNDLSSVTAINNVSTVYFRLVDTSTTSANGGTVATAGTDRVDNFAVNAATGTPPSISGISPSSITTNAGTSVPITVTLSAGDAPFTYYWYKGGAGYSNPTLISTVATSALTNTLTLSNVLKADSAYSYWVVVSNGITPNATSAEVSLAVNDPAINVEPVSQTGLLGGTAQFTVSAGGTGLSYQWYFTDGGGAIIGPVNDVTQADGSIITGSRTSTLQIANLQNADATDNFVVIVSGTAPGNDSPQTSSVASLSVASTGVALAFWNFNSPFMNIANPAPYQGIGTASSMNVTTFVQPNPDADDPASPNTAWGTEAYPATGLNKQAGVQFNTSTLGAKNVNVSFDLRATGSASKYQRLQFTTNGTTWVDYPASETFPGGDVNIYTTYTYSLNGFPGVANNPNFGIRIVSEFESTARYNDTNDAVYVPVTSTDNYGTAGTLSYDLVTITADAIIGNNHPPTISAISNPTMEDTYGTTVTFTVSDDTTPAGSLGVTAACLDPNLNLSSLNPVNTGGTVQLSINSSLGNSVANYAPILITVTDGNGNVTSAWFTLEIDPANSPPVLAGLTNTNMLPNSSLVIPFTLTDDHTSPGAMTPTASSGNSTLLPNNGAHLSFGGAGSNRTLVITPVANQEGAAPVTVSATDGGGLTTSQTILLQVRPNTNVVLIDYFDYDNAGPIVTESGGLWQTHSGTAGQMQVASGVVTVDGVNHTEDVNAQFIGEPYAANNAAELYTSYIINYTTLPDANGSYDTHFKDDTTSNYLGRVWASTIGAASGDYRIGIANVTNVSTSAVFFPQDLVLNSNYVVVTRLVLSNWNSTIWVNPTSESSPSVTDIASVSTSATNISAYALRESTADEGIMNISKLKVGLTFDSVFPSLQVQSSPPKVVVNWSDPTLGIQSATSVAGPWSDVSGAKPPYTNNSPPNAVFYKFGQ